MKTQGDNNDVKKKKKLGHFIIKEQIRPNNPSK